MIFFGLVGVFIILVTESKLQGTIPIRSGGSYLSNHAGSCFNNRTGGLNTTRIEDTCHPNLFANYTFHVRFIYSRKVVQDISSASGGRGQSWFIADLFL